MKKTTLMVALIALLASCGSNEKKPSATNDSGTTKDLSANPDYKKGLALVGSNDCLGCHKVDENYTGPAYTAIAKKYAGQPGAEDSLAQKIIKGGSGNWGTMIMTPHPGLSEDDAKSMVKYILTLNQ